MDLNTLLPSQQTLSSRSSSNHAGNSNATIIPPHLAAGPSWTCPRTCRSPSLVSSLSTESSSSNNSQFSSLASPHPPPHAPALARPPAPARSYSSSATSSTCSSTPDDDQHYYSNYYLAMTRTDALPDAPPPEYGSEFTVEPLTVKNKPPRALRILLESPPTKPFENGEIILGTLQVAPKSNILVSSLTIALEGEEVTSRSSWTHEHFLRRHMKLNVQEISNLPPDTILRTGFLYSFPFSIEVPDLLKSSACRDIEDHGHLVGDYHLRVPPTLAYAPESPSTATDVPNNVARITYKLTAVLKVFCRLSSSIKAHASTYVYVDISPSYAVAPEVLVPPAAPFKAFLDLPKRSGRISGSSRKTAGVAQMTFDYYPILPVSSKAVTMLPVSIKFYPNKSDPLAQPPPIRKFSVYLKARTVYSNKASFTTLPTNFNAIRSRQIESRYCDVVDPSKGLSLNASTGSSNTHLPLGFKEVFHTYIITQMDTLSGFKWPQTPVPVSPNSSRLVYDAMFAIPIVMPKSYRHSLIPSYHSCFTMRDYTVVVCAEFSLNCILNIELPAVLVKNQSDAISNVSIPGYSLYPEVPLSPIEKPSDQSASSPSPSSSRLASHSPSPAFLSTRPLAPRSPHDLSPHSAEAAASSAYSSTQDDLLVVEAFENKVPKGKIASLLASRLS